MKPTKRLFHQIYSEWRSNQFPINVTPAINDTPSYGIKFHAKIKINRLVTLSSVSNDGKCPFYPIYPFFNGLFQYCSTVQFQQSVIDSTYPFRKGMWNVLFPDLSPFKLIFLISFQQIELSYLLWKKYEKPIQPISLTEYPFYPIFLFLIVFSKTYCNKVWYFNLMQSSWIKEMWEKSKSGEVGLIRPLCSV